MSTHTHPSLVTAAVRTADPHVVRGRPTPLRSMGGGRRPGRDRGLPRPPRTLGSQFPIQEFGTADWGLGGPRSTNACRPGRQSGSVVRRALHVWPARRPRPAQCGRRSVDSHDDAAGLVVGARSSRCSSSPNTLRTRATTFTITTISATTSISSGSTGISSTPAPISTDPDSPLDQAQQAKLDLVCRKLQLRPGDTVVEAGCGWGALALHMARHYGVRVKAFNVSREQLAFARERADARRTRPIASSSSTTTIATSRGQFDAFVSVGMLEHVGLRQSSAAFGEVIRRSLRRDGGRGLLHFIGRDAPCPLNPWIRRRIFPGAYTPTLAEVTSASSPRRRCRSSTSRTCACTTRGRWSCGRQRFEAAQESVRAAYGEPFARAWELYLAGSQAAFATGWMQLFQVVFAPRETSPPFWTRAAIFEANPERQAGS